MSLAPPIRCAWATTAPEFPRYHDKEWGWPVADDRRLFEKLSLEAFQSGLSWRTILVKRPAFREAFAQFDPETVAGFGPADVERLLDDAGIVRHRGKIEAVINNAARVLELDEPLGTLVWRYESAATGPQTRSTCPESVALSKELKRRGWKFVGPTTVYAFMQACGMVNDHEPACHLHEKIDAARAAFRRPA